MNRSGIAPTGTKGAASTQNAHICSACQGRRMKPVVTSVVFFWTAIPTIVENVPALRCLDCGEQHLDIAVAGQLDKIRLAAGDAVAQRHVSVPVVDFAIFDAE